MTEGAIATRPSPYKGLAAFDDSDLDALFFFGRERDTEVIAANVMASRFTVLYGPLGVGKSSVLRAGVARRLRSLARDAAVVVHASWAGDAGGDLVAAAADAVAVEAPAADVPLADGLAETAALFGGDLYLVLDQFEELFVYPHAAGFTAELAEVVTRPDVRVNVLVALREDALADLDVFTGRLPNVFGNYVTLNRLDRTAARAAVTGPIGRYNELDPDARPIEIEADLVEAVLDEVEVGRVVLGGLARGSTDGGARGEIEAAYLQLVMERLWQAETERGSHALRRATLEELGGAQAIVRAHFDDAIHQLVPGERDLAARVFNHLVTPSGTKVAHEERDLAEYAGVEEQELRPVLASLGRSRILRPVDGRVEIFHDVLADAVLAWRTRHERERALDRERAEAQRRNRRLLLLLAASLVALAVMAAVLVYALTQRAEAREQSEAARAEALSAKASQLATEASAVIPVARVDVDPELGLLLAVEAAKMSPTARTADILRRALLVSHLRDLLPERRVTTASFSPAGSQIVVGTADGTVRVYARDTRRLSATLQFDAPIAGASLNPEGRLLLTDPGGPARVWDTAAGRELETFGEAPTAASFSSDGSLVLTVEPRGARVWTTEDGRLVAALRQPDRVRQASFGPNSERVVTIGARNVTRVFEARSGRLVAAVNHGGVTTSAALTPDGDGLVTTGNDRVARIWSLRGGGRLVHELTGHRGQITAGVVAPSGEILATTSTDGTARVWELPSGRLVADLAGHTNRVDGAAFNRDSDALVTWSSDGTARVWDTSTGATRVLLGGHDDVVTGASFDASGEFVLTTSADGRARLWASDVEDDLRVIARVSKPIGTAAFARDGRLAAVTSGTGVEIRNAADGRRIAFLSTRPVDALAQSDDGMLIAVSQGERTTIWRVAAPIGVLEDDEPTTAVALSPDGRRVATGTMTGAVRLWTPDGGRVADFDGPGASAGALVFSPSGDRLAAGFADGTLAAWDVREERRVFERIGHERGTAVMSVAFSATGQRFVTAGADGTVRVWDATGGRPLYALRGHYGKVTDAAFSPDGRWIVTAGPNSAGLWDVATRQRLLFLRGHAGRVLEASFDATGLRIATVGADGTLRAYACQICGGVPQLLELAERRIAATGRTLTAAERLRYLAGL